MGYLVGCFQYPVQRCNCGKLVLQIFERPDPNRPSDAAVGMRPEPAQLVPKIAARGNKGRTRAI
jgi:hypothetical protein